MFRIGYLVLAGLLLTGTASGLTLQDGTEIPVRLVENVNGNINFTGESVFFQVVDDIKVEGQTVISKGTFVKGMVHEAVGRKSMGKGGKLTLMPKSLSTSSGDLIKFEKYPLSQEGRKRTGATVAHVVMWGPLGLFAKGRAAFMFRETEFDITVNGQYELPPIAEITDTAEVRKDFKVEFRDYSKKINYRKGKIGNDFEVLVHISDEYDAGDVVISGVDGYQLPRSIKPVSQEVYKKNKSQMMLTFAFRDIIKYAVPETTHFEFQIGKDYSSEAILTTEWKLK